MKNTCHNLPKEIESITIDGANFYVNDVYWGVIIEKNDNYFRVRCDNGNMEGEIFTINYNLRLIIN